MKQLKGYVKGAPIGEIDLATYGYLKGKALSAKQKRKSKNEQHQRRG